MGADASNRAPCGKALRDDSIDLQIGRRAPQSRALSPLLRGATALNTTFQPSIG